MSLIHSPLRPRVHTARALVLVVAAGCIGACQRTANTGQALVVFAVEIGAGVTPFDTITFTSDAGVPARTVAARDAGSFHLGYYLPPGETPVTINAEARHGSCVVGSGTARISERREAGREVRGDTLFITARAEAPCRMTGAAPDGGAAAPDMASPAAVEAGVPPGGSGETGADGPLTVVAFSPADRSKDADRRAPIVITFSRPIDPATLARAITVMAGSAAVSGGAAADADGRVVTFTPAAPLPMLASITVNVGLALRDRQGGALAAAQSASFGTADGKWTKAEMIQANDNQKLDDSGGTVAVAADPKGNALVVWERFVALPAADDHRTVLHASRYTAGKGWDAGAQIVSNANGRTLLPSLALDSQGRGVLLTSLNRTPTGPMVTGSIASLAFDPDKGWLPAVASIDRHEGGFAAGARLSMLPTGEAVVSWSWYSPSYDRWIESSRFAMGTWGPVSPRLDRPQGTPFTFHYNTASALDRNGGVMTIWSGASGRDFDTFEASVQAARFTPQAGWSAPVKITKAPKHIGSNDCPAQVVVDGSGNAVVAWAEGAGMNVDTVAYAYFHASMSKWEEPLVLATNNSEPTIRLASNAGGAALLAFSDRGSVRAARISSIPMREDGTSTRPGQINDMRAGIDDRERGVVAWREGSAIYAWRYLPGMPETPVKLNVADAAGPPELHVLGDGRAFIAWVEDEMPHRLMSARFE